MFLGGCGTFYLFHVLGDSSNWVLLLCVVRAARSAANVGHMTDSTVFSLLAVSNMHRTDMKESLLEWLNSFTR